MLCEKARRSEELASEVPYRTPVITSRRLANTHHSRFGRGDGSRLKVQVRGPWRNAGADKEAREAQS